MYKLYANSQSIPLLTEYQAAAERMSSMHNTVIVAHIKKEMDAMSRCLTPSVDLAVADDDDYNNGSGAEYTRGAGGGRGSGNGGDDNIVIVGGGGGDESDDESQAERDIESQQRDKEQSGPSPAKCIRLVQVNSCDGATMLSSSSPTPSPVAASHAPSSPERHDCSSTMPGDGLFLLHEGTNKDDDSPKRLCLVCGDVASGFHYGVASCEACKAFFKRTIQGNIEYTCPASNDCEINKRRRKACQACRFQKCLRMGMLKEGVRLDRVRGGRQKYRRNPEPHFLSTVSLMTKKPSLEGESRSTMRVQSTENKLLLALSNCEPDPLLANPDPSVPDSEFKLVSTLSDLVDRELVCTISWAKQIPGFTELSLDDQMRLLQSSWVEILTLGLAYRSLPKVGRLRFAPDLVLDVRQARQCQAEEMFAQTIHVVDRLERLVVQREEYLLMKALLLVNSDVRVDDYNGLRRLRDTILLALNDCVSTLRPQAQQHLGGLLLCLPALRQVDGAVRRFWSHVKREAQVPMQKLLVEMLESQLV